MYNSPNNQLNLDGLIAARDLHHSGEFRKGIGQLKTNCPGRLRETNDEFWLRLGGEEKEHRIQKTEFRMSNDEVRLPRSCAPRNDAARVPQPLPKCLLHKMMAL